MSLNPHYAVTIMQSESRGGSPFVNVTAPMPDTFTFDTQSEYQAPFSQGLFGTGAISNLAKIGGIRLTSQALTAQIWQGATDIQLGLELEFQAESDPDREVRQPIMALMRLSTASRNASTGMLQAPGPQLDIETAGQIVNEAGKQLKDSATYAYAALTGSKQSSLSDSNSSRNGNNENNGVPSNGGLGQADAWKNKIKNQISIQIGTYAFFDSVVVSNVQQTYASQFDANTGLPMYAKVAIQFKPMFLLLQSDLEQIFANHSSAR